MTEYSVEKFYNEYAIKQEDTIIAVIDSGTNARKVCGLLNEQEEKIQEYKHLVKIATSLILLNTIPEVRKEWQKHLSKVGDD